MATVLVDGEWREVASWAFGAADGTLVPATLFNEPQSGPVEPAPYTEPAFHASGAFEPLLELDAGAEVQWLDAATRQVAGVGAAPVLGAGVWLLSGDLAGVRTINLGFNASEDAGRYSVGASYNREPRQPVTQLENLGQLTGLRRLLAACPSLAGELDLTGLAQLEYVECYRAGVESVVLDGCVALIRLCLEQCQVTYADLTPVRNVLRDLRLAGQSGGALTVECDGDLSVLYHYCTRGNVGVVNVPVEQMPVVEQWWTWSSGLTTVGTPVSPLLNSLRTYNNALDQASVDRLLQWVADSVTRTNGSVRVDAGTNSPPSAVGLLAVDAIRAKGIGVDHN